GSVQRRSRLLLARLVRGAEQIVVRQILPRILGRWPFRRGRQLVGAALEREAVRAHVGIPARAARIAAQDAGAPRLAISGVVAANVRAPEAMVQDAAFAGATLRIAFARSAPAILAGEGHSAEARAVAGRLDVEIDQHALPFAVRTRM